MESYIKYTSKGLITEKVFINALLFGVNSGNFI